MNVISFESYVLYSSSAILCCVEAVSLNVLWGDGFQSGLQVFSWGNLYFAEERKGLALGREGIGTSMMIQLVDCTIDTSQFLRRERDERLLDMRS